MPAVRPDPTVALVGRYVRLDALQRGDVPTLYPALAHRQVFAGGFGGGPAAFRPTLDEFVEWGLGYYAWGTHNVYAVRLVGGEHDGLLIGATTIGDFDLPLESAHIGWTAYDPRVWGTQVNIEAKLLLLGSAFDSGLGRVKIVADALNERSRAAIAGIGATFEGIIRRERPRADGSWRDTAQFAITIDDWPRVRALLEERLAAFDGRPVEFRPPRGTR